MPKLLLVLFFSACALAQPLIFNRSVLNAASYVPNRLPGGAIAQGSIFSIFGARLGPTPAAQANAFPLGTTLANVAVTISQGSNSVNAIPLFVGDGQINAIMPSNAPVGAASVRVSYNNARSNPMTVMIAPSAFGIFTATGTGLGPGILQNFVSAAVQPINSATVAAKRGQAITLWGTGLGPVSADNVAPTAGNLPVKVEVSVGGVNAAVLYSGRTPCCSGTDQIVFQVPDNAPLECWVPVYVRTAGSTVSNAVTMAITEDGSSCFGFDPPPAFVTGGRSGALNAFRVTTRQDLGTRAPIDVTADYQSGAAVQVPNTAFPFHPVYSYPPDGTCTMFSVKGDLLRGDPLPGAQVYGNHLATGSEVTFAGPRGMKVVTNLWPGSLLTYLGGGVTGNFFTNNLFLDPGKYQVSGVAGIEVEAFSVSVAMPQPLTWTNRDQLLTVDRTQPLNLSWTGGAADQNVTIAGFGVDLPNNSTSIFGCVAGPGVTRFTVPAAFLSNFPATRANPLQSKGVIYLINRPASGSADLKASGLDISSLVLQSAIGKTVIFR